jgi:hypothetical protein
VEQLYANSPEFFVLSAADNSWWLARWVESFYTWWTGRPLMGGFHWDRPKYDPTRIHDQIDAIVDSVFPDFIVRPTMRDLDRRLNPAGTDPAHYRSLVINTFEAATNRVRMVDSSRIEHGELDIKDVLKATMAAPYYFPPHTHHRTFLDGGIYANDPMLTGLHCARLNGHIATDFSQYRVVGIGTGVCDSALLHLNNSPPHGGVRTWSLGNPPALLLNTVLEANRSLTETISEGLSHFGRIRRFKFNVGMHEPTQLDNFAFVTDMDVNGPKWNGIRQLEDMQGLVQFLTHQMH